MYLLSDPLDGVHWKPLVVQGNDEKIEKPQTAVPPLFGYTLIIPLLADGWRNTVNAGS